MNWENKISLSISISTDGGMRAIKEKTAMNQFNDKFVIKSKFFGRIPCIKNRNTEALTVMN
jgi:hypothetical protein